MVVRSIGPEAKRKGELQRAPVGCCSEQMNTDSHEFEHADRISAFRRALRCAPGTHRAGSPLRGAFAQTDLGRRVFVVAGRGEPGRLAGNQPAEARRVAEEFRWGQGGMVLS